MEQNIIKTLDFLGGLEKEYGMIGTIVAVLTLIVVSLGALLTIGFIIQIWMEVANICFKIITNGGTIG